MIDEQVNREIRNDIAREIFMRLYPKAQLAFEVDRSKESFSVGNCALMAIAAAIEFLNHSDWTDEDVKKWSSENCILF